MAADPLTLLLPISLFADLLAKPNSNPPLSCARRPYELLSY